MWGKAPGLPNSVAMSQNLVNIETGELARVLSRRPNGNKTLAKATLDSLSNAVSACAKGAERCRALLLSANAGLGIGIDSKGHVRVANFRGQRVSHFCGSQLSKCPKGKKTGDGISPRSAGYGFDGLQRNTGMGIDPSGNLWSPTSGRTSRFRSTRVGMASWCSSDWQARSRPPRSEFRSSRSRLPVDYRQSGDPLELTHVVSDDRQSSTDRVSADQGVHGSDRRTGLLEVASDLSIDLDVSTGELQHRDQCQEPSYPPRAIGGLLLPQPVGDLGSHNDARCDRRVVLSN